MALEEFDKEKRKLWIFDKKKRKRIINSLQDALVIEDVVNGTSLREQQTRLEEAREGFDISFWKGSESPKSD